MSIPKRVTDRIKTGLRIFRKILEDARHADRSEQDTVTIVTDMLADVFGYDKYSELTGEYAIRGTFCDVAVSVEGKIRFLIEVKSVDKTLKENHLRQATDYAAKEGIEWVVLTNGVEWQAYRMIFEQPVRFEQVFTINMLEDGNELIDLIYLLSREGITKSKLEEYHEQRQILNRHVVSAVILSEPITKTVRRELRKMSPGMKVSPEEIEELLRSEILKRDIVEGEELKDAVRKIKRATRRSSKAKPATSPKPEIATAPPATSVTPASATLPQDQSSPPAPEQRADQ